MSTRRFGLPILVCLAVIAGATCLVSTVSREVLVNLLVGWAIFLTNVWPKVHIDWIAVAVAGVAAALFVIGVHRFLRWWVHETTHGAEDRSNIDWKFRWSAAWITVLLIAFAAGTALVGMTHQLVWAIGSPRKLTHLASGDRADAHSNLRTLHSAVSSYFSAHGTGARVGNHTGREGEVDQSWITAIAPYQGYLLDKLRFDKPWNHPENLEQFRRLYPSVMHPGYDISTWRDRTGYGLAHFAANANLMSDRAPGLNSVVKGGSNTILIGQVSDELEPWGKPGHVRDPALGIGKSPAGFGGPPTEQGALFLMADGSVRYLDRDIDNKVLAALGQFDVAAD